MARRGMDFLISFLGDNTDLSRKVNEIPGEVEGAVSRIELSELGERLGNDLKGAILGVGIGAALADGIQDNLEIDAAASKVEARLNLTADEAERVGELGASLYREAWGDSTTAVIDALGRVGSGLVDLGETGDDELSRLTTQALDVAAVFDQDVNEVIRSAELLLRNNLAGSAQEAMDLLGRGFQLAGDRGDDFADTIKEYSQHFSAMGLSGEEAIGIIVAGLEDGQWNADKLADAIKEFGIRAKEDTEGVQEAFAQLGLDAGEMQDAIAAGGPAAREAFGQVVDALLTVEDPLEQGRIAVELFGTQMEDLGPGAIDSLRPVAGALGEVDGAAQNISTTFKDHAGVAFDEFGRKLGAVNDEITEAAMPALESMAGVGSDLLDVVLNLPDPLQGVIGGVAGIGTVAVPVISQLGDIGFGIRGISDAASILSDKLGTGGGAGLLGKLGLLAGAAVVAYGAFEEFKGKPIFDNLEDEVRGLIDELGPAEAAVQSLESAFTDSSLTEVANLLGDADISLRQVGEAAAGSAEDWDTFRKATLDAIPATAENSWAVADLIKVLDEARSAATDAMENQQALTRITEESTEAAEAEAVALEFSGHAAARAAVELDGYTDSGHAAARAMMEGETASARLADEQLILASVHHDTARAAEAAEAAERGRLSAVLESIDADLAYESALDRTQGAIDDYRVAVDESGAASEEASDAANDAAETAIRLAQAKIRAAAAARGLTVEELSVADKAQIMAAELGGVANVLDDDGPLRGNLAGYIAQILDVPPEMVTEFLAQLDEAGVAEAEARLDHLSRTRDVWMQVKVSGASASATLADAQLVMASAEGNIIDRPMLSLVGEDAPTWPEYIIPTNPLHRDRAVKLLGAATKDIAGFASGGGPARAFGRWVENRVSVHVDATKVADPHELARLVEDRVRRSLDRERRLNGRALAGSGAQ